MSGKQKRVREVTGRTVLIYLLGFFGVVFAANALLVKAATSTFGGLEVASSYKAGLRFNADEAQAHSQDGLRWQVSGKIERDGAGMAKLVLDARDSHGIPLSGLAVETRLVHPADARRDRVIPMRETIVGVFSGAAPAAAGQWELVIDLMRGDERVFRSQSRVVLR
jgi:nitrogen fixation protein FixH